MQKRLLLPQTIHGAAGIEMSLYFANVFETLNPANYAFHFHSSCGSCCEERWHFTPGKEHTGSFEARLDVLDDEGLKAEGACRLVIHDPALSEGKKIRLLMIGDSLTDQSHYPTHIHTLCRRYGIGLEMLGTNVPEHFRLLPGQLIRYPAPELLPGVRHEGYGGWSAGTFLTRARALQTDPFHHWHCGSPFLNSDGVFDFRHYLEKHCSGEAPDVIMIGLGGNDMGMVDDGNHEEVISNFLTNFKTLYAALRKDAPETVFGIVLDPYGAASQSAWGKNYGCSRFHRNVRKYYPVAYRELETYFSSLPKTFIVPLYHAIDPFHGYPEETAEIFEGSPGQLTRQSNALHPSPAGYCQMGAAAFAWLLDVIENHLQH